VFLFVKPLSVSKGNARNVVEFRVSSTFGDQMDGIGCEPRIDGEG
jgi:hypothetical protein